MSKTKKFLNIKSINKKTLIAVALVILIALITTANLTIFNKPVSNIGSSSASTQEPADINSDSVVDIVDLSILLSNWNTTDNLSDINNDNAVDIVDLSILLSKWGNVVGSPESQICPKYPAFPDANCTGWQHTGVTLSAYSGPTNITVSGTVIDSKDISDCISVNANNVTIMRTRIRCVGGKENTTSYGMSVGSVSGLVVEDVEIMSSVIPSNCSSGDPNLMTRPVHLGGSNGVRFTRLHAHNMRSGFWISGSDNTIIEDSYITTDCNPDPHGTGADWQHSTAIADLGGATNVTIRHNNIDNGAENASSAMSLYPQYGPNDNFLITENLFNSRAWFCAYLGYTPGSEQPNTRFTVTNNVWGTKYNPECGAAAPVVYSNFDLDSFNASYPQGWGNVWSGNTWKNGTPYLLSDL